MDIWDQIKEKYDYNNWGTGDGKNRYQPGEIRVPTIAGYSLAEVGSYEIYGSFRITYLKETDDSVRIERHSDSISNLYRW